MDDVVMNPIAHST